MICEKCGFDYESEKCPVCEMELKEIKQDTVLQGQKKGLGIAGMIVSIIGLAMYMLCVPVSMFAIMFFSYLGAIAICPLHIFNLATSIAGLILSASAKQQGVANVNATLGKVFSIVGISSNIVAIAISIITFVLWMLLIIVIFVIYMLIFVIYVAFGVAI